MYVAMYLTCNEIIVDQYYWLVTLHISVSSQCKN